MSLARWNVAAPSRLLWLLVVLLLALPSPALGQAAADPPAAPGPAPAAPAPRAAAPAPRAAAQGIPLGSWAGELETLSRWLDQRRGSEACVERCYALERLRITGAVGEGPLHFELSGAVLADGPVAVPLFGPPEHVRVEAVLEADGRAARREPAPISFAAGHYYLWTAARRFVLRGTMELQGDLTLTIPGPLNSFEADVIDGAVVEGSRLSGLSGATLHFSRDGDAAQSAGPTVFQLSRAVRIGREIGFEYRLVMRSGTDLGVVRLPLVFGEKVLDVSGASGFRVEGGELVLPTSGRTAEMTISGTLPKVGSFTPDPRSPYEWWLFESDAEHRLTVKGDVRQVDVAESPIPPTQATSRLLLVQRGQRVEVSVEPLASVEVLAAVVRGHRRTLVLTERGDLVADDALTYENNGIDYLSYAPGGRPIYLATDGKAQRIMHQGAAAAAEVLVPLQTGSHSIQVQSLAQAALRPLGGTLELPMPRYPLTASHVALTVGMPERVVPLALLGGDRPVWFADAGDAVAVVLGFLAAWIAVRPGGAPSRGRLRALRVLGGLVLAGLWFVAPATFVAILVGIATAGVAWLAGRLFRGTARAVAIAVLVGAGCLALLAGLFAVSAGRYPQAVGAMYETASAPAASRSADVKPSSKATSALAPGGAVLEGVTPVALSLPSYARSLHVRRELVTRDRAFRPVLVYATSSALLPLGLLWLAGAALLFAAHRAPLAELYRRAAERVARKPDGDGDGRPGGRARGEP
ncbi:hypothetical protein SOCEGT47_051850 [Sorangium cellulosum]|uniref:Uncharacterized protein n=1 Tax=Sorangium cellulosum TaxID=56 RepID=A0A4P2Q6A3_SORCE|nr:tripartite tricarboxylate transporter TctB family protein [Sorangium cellulosum]AUX24646.1 hypothetical protein SOCEGT47_051850 [Sorangium cellulosum]